MGAIAGAVYKILYKHFV